MLSSFWVSYLSLRALALSCDQNPVPLLFTLNVMSAYEGDHMIFGLLGKANVT
jgi:hypothetical protein